MLEENLECDVLTGGNSDSDIKLIRFYKYCMGKIQEWNTKKIFFLGHHIKRLGFPN